MFEFKTISCTYKVANLFCRIYEKTNSMFFVASSLVPFHSFHYLGRVSGFDGDESHEMHPDHKIAYLRYIAALSMKATNALLKSIGDLNPWCDEENGGT